MNFWLGVAFFYLAILAIILLIIPIRLFRDLKSRNFNWKVNAFMMFAAFGTSISGLHLLWMLFLKILRLT